MRPAHFLGLVVALAALSLLGVVAKQHIMASKELYIAICSSVDDGSGARKLTYKEDGTVYWVGEPIVKASDMTAFRTRDAIGRIAVYLELIDEDSTALSQAMQANIDGQICVVHDGEILMVATISGKVTTTRFLVTGDSLDWEGIIAHVNGAD